MMPPTTRDWPPISRRSGGIASRGKNLHNVTSRNREYVFGIAANKNPESKKNPSRMKINTTSSESRILIDLAPSLWGSNSLQMQPTTEHTRTNPVTVVMPLGKGQLSKSDEMRRPVSGRDAVRSQVIDVL
jgi:hypothetical protein